MWSTLTATDILRLERSHRFCVKNMQSFPIGTSTDFALNALSIGSIETFIEYRKLQFLGQLCRLSNMYIAKHIFNNRLLHFINFDNQTHGFIPDTYRILQKYELNSVLDNYVTDGRFPTKYTWKRMLHASVLLPERQNSVRAITSEFNTLSPIFPYDNKPCKLWSISRNNPRLLYMCNKLMNITSRYVSRKYVSKCKKCECLNNDIVQHLLCYCNINTSNRKIVWDILIEKLGTSSYNSFIQLSPKDQCDMLLTLAYEIESNSFKYYKLADAICKMSY